MRFQTLNGGYPLEKGSGSITMKAETFCLDDCEKRFFFQFKDNYDNCIGGIPLKGFKYHMYYSGVIDDCY